MEYLMEALLTLVFAWWMALFLGFDPFASLDSAITLTAGATILALTHALIDHTKGNTK